MRIDTGRRWNWMSADGRINYMSNGTAWAAGARSATKGGRASDVEVLVEAGLMNHAGAPRYVHRTRADAVAAVSSAFADNDPPVERVSKSLLPYRLAGALSEFGIAKEDEGWRLSGPRHIPYGTPVYSTILQTETDYEKIDEMMRSLMGEWMEIREGHYPTRIAAYEELVAWLQSVGVDTDA